MITPTHVYTTPSQTLTSQTLLSLIAATFSNATNHSLNLLVDSVGGAGFEPTKSHDNRFTVCPSWPLWYPPLFSTMRNIFLSQWPDSNRRPAVYKTAALPLSYTGMEMFGYFSNKDDFGAYRFSPYVISINTSILFAENSPSNRFLTI